jgi:kynurenine formamidase
MTGVADLPTFAELPVIGADEHHAWDAFGPGDELGCLNFITSDSVVAAATEVQTGRVVNLNLPLNEPQPQFWADRQPLHHEHVVKRNIRDDYLDSFQMQGSTQWDGLRHQRFRQFGWYGGRQESDLERGELGIERWSERGIVGRGILADVAGYLAERGTPLAPDRRFAIEGSLIESVLEAQGTECRSGDILLLRTGWLGWYMAIERSEREAMAEELNRDRSAIQLPGLAPSKETAAWLWNHRIAALAIDNPTAETVPYRPEEGWAHTRLIPLLGLPLGELWAVDDLAAVCAEEQRYSFFLSSAPLNLPGGAGSPANAYAIL